MVKYSEQVRSDAVVSAALVMLRLKQEAVVRHVLCSRDFFVSLPTGSGKSVTPFFFQYLTKCTR